MKEALFHGRKAGTVDVGVKSVKPASNTMRMPVSRLAMYTMGSWKEAYIRSWEAYTAWWEGGTHGG